MNTKSDSQIMLYRAKFNDEGDRLISSPTLDTMDKPHSSSTN